MTDQDERCDVAIVGFGPTGATLANLLGREGIRTVVVERAPEIHTLPRAVHFDHEVMRIFQGIGLADAILPHTGPVQGYEFLNAEGKVLLAFDVRDRVSSQGWRHDYMFHQPSLERVLRDGATARETVSLRLGSELVGLAQDAEGVTLTLREADGGGERRLRCRYVVGCDGASSPTRRLAGLPVEDLAFDEPWLVVDGTIERPPAAVGLPAIPIQRCDPRRPVTFVPVAGPHVRWEFMLLPGEGEEMRSPERVRALVAEWMDPDAVTVIRSALYRFHALVAGRWRDGRVLIAGDAAHQMPPFLGQGMCAGIRDADNLAWKLALVLRGVVPDAVLDSYARERAPHVRAVVRLAIDLGRIICTLDPEEAAARDARMLGGTEAGTLPPGLPGLADGVLEPAPGHPLRGSLALQAHVRGPDGRVALLDDVTGPGATLLRAAGAPALPAAARETLARLGGREVLLAADPAAEAGEALVVEDVEGAYRAWLAEHGVGAVLVRPDHAVFGAGAAQDAPALVRCLATALGA